MTPKKKSTADLRQRYPILFEIGLILSLLLTVALFTIPLQHSERLELVETQQEIVLVEEVEQTQQQERPPPPPRPPAPIEVANEVETEDIVLDLDMDLDLAESVSAPPKPPPPPAAAAPEPEPEPEEPEVFVIVEQMPELIGGIGSIQERIVYPEIARRAGIEGTVYLQFVIDENGDVNDPVCVRDPGGNTCEAALTALRDAKFTPGRQRGKPVRVQFSLPVRFRLR